jgi:hypothetical protein
MSQSGNEVQNFNSKLTKLLGIVQDIYVTTYGTVDADFREIRVNLGRALALDSACAIKTFGKFLADHADTIFSYDIEAFLTVDYTTYLPNDHPPQKTEEQRAKGQIMFAHATQQQKEDLGNILVNMLEYFYDYSIKA